MDECLAGHAIDKGVDHIDVGDVWGSAACSNDKAGGSSHRRARTTLATATYLACQLSWGQNLGKHVVRVGVIEDVAVYPSQFGLYVQQPMILILKSTQNLGCYNRV
jgi:hypothetical protein